MQTVDQPGSRDDDTVKHGKNGTNGTGVQTELEVSVDVVDFASLRAKWGHHFAFENNLLADKTLVDEAARLIDALITEIGAENLRKKIITIAVGPNMGVLFMSDTLIYSPGQPFTANIRYACATLKIPLPAAYQTTAVAAEGPTELGNLLPEDAALMEPGAAEPEPTAGPTGEPTQVVHVRAFPREWEVVDPRRNENILVQIGQSEWESFFRLEAIGDDGCFVRVVLPKNLRPLPLDENCRLSMELADGTPFNIQGKIQSAGINSLGEATMKILFNITADDAVKLTYYREQLKEIPEEQPEPDADVEPGIPPDDALEEALEALPQEPRTITRKRIFRILGGAAAAVFLFTAGGAIYLAQSPEKIVRKPTQEEVPCSVLFDERGYRPKCPGTTKPRLTWTAGQQKGAPVLRAGIAFDRGNQHCETEPDAVTVIRGESMSAVNKTFTCASPQR